MESVTGLSVSVTRLWEMMSGLWVVWVWVLVGHYVVESGLFGFVGMDLAVVVAVVVLWVRFFFFFFFLRLIFGLIVVAVEVVLVVVVGYG